MRRRRLQDEPGELIVMATAAGRSALVNARANHFSTRSTLSSRRACSDEPPGAGASEAAASGAGPAHASAGTAAGTARKGAAAVSASQSCSAAEETQKCATGAGPAAAADAAIGFIEQASFALERIPFGVTPAALRAGEEWKTI